MPIAVVGSANVDLVTFCERFPVDGETLMAQRFEQHFGGKGANQAVMAARLGGRVAFIGAVGDDELGRATIADLSAAGIDTSGISITQGVPTGVATITVDAHGANRILVAAGANETLAPYAVINALIRAAPKVVVAQCETPVEATVTAFTYARTIEAITVLNPAPYRGLCDEVYALADWLVPNETEFLAMWGDRATPASVDAAAKAWNCRMVVTMGAAGAIMVDGDRAVEVPALEVEAVDTTGAGDAFVGGFACALASGLSSDDAVRIGVACGSLSVTLAGARSAFPTREALARYVDFPDG
ncbi:MAG: ribokinase [Acidimicrobiia bacterium]